MCTKPSTTSQDLPQPFLDRLQLILPPNSYQQCLQTFYREPQTTFRVNPLKTNTTDLQQELDSAEFTPTALPWKTDAFTIPAHQRRALTENAACRQGRLYIQNPSSMIPPLILEPQTDEWILDLAAAPGSKTIQLAGMMDNQGKISAVESVRSRFFRLKTNLETYGATNVQTYLKDGTKVWKQCPELFDRVLLDAPCSSEGQFNTHHPSSYAYWSAKKIREMQRKQKRLLFSAVQCLKPGGILLYSTCTFAPEENELMIHYILDKFPDTLSVEKINLPLDNVQEGLVQWQDQKLHPDLGRAIRILPDGPMEAFFLCRLKKIRSTHQ
jgi:16S rRNA (cytosine1407-C5)-methyltransferase